MFRRVRPLSRATSTKRNGASAAVTVTARAARSSAPTCPERSRRARMTGSVNYARHSVRTFCTRLAVCLTILGACAAPAAAQKDSFRDALIGFHSKLAGDEGNEGPVVLAALQR